MVLNATKPSLSGKSGPAVPNLDGGIKVGTFDPVVISPLSHRLRLRHRCAT